MEEGIKPVFITAEDVPPVKISENAETVLFKRYYRKDESGKPVENAQQMFIRVANAVANADHNQAIVYSLAKDFYEAMTDKFFLPNSPTLMNAGLPDGQLAACFVLPVGDSIPEIFDAVKHAAMIHKSGGGTGFSFSRIRPKNSCVRTTGGVASGPVSFMRIFDTATEQIKQGGCFPAGTLVATADGPVPIEQLREGQLVFSFDPNEGFVLRPCTDAFMTKRNQRIWELTTDKKFSVGSTKDHPYMLRSSGAKNGLKYTKLEDLKPGIPLMPLSMFTKNGDYTRMTLQDGKDTRVYVHKWIAQQIGLGEKTVHHIDENKRNFRMSNLGFFDCDEDHVAYHSKKRMADGTHPFLFLTDEQIRKRASAYSEYWKALSEEERAELRNKNSAALVIENAKRMQNGTHNFIGDRHPSKSEDGRLLQRKGRVLRSIWAVLENGGTPTVDTWEKCAKEAGLYNAQRYTLQTVESLFGSFDAALVEAASRNHKVVSIRDTGRDEDVWNVEVPGTHNFVVCDADMQHGLVVSNTRRGANMGILRVDHPDIFEFIRAKEHEGEITNFNLSVGLTERFMQAVENNTEYALVDPSTGKEVERVVAREVFDLLVEKAWQSGDPGIVFLDRINENNPLPEQGDIEATNPCVSGDTPLFTDNGNLPIAGLVGKTVTAWNGFEWSDVTPEVTGHDQPMLRVTFSEGSTLVCTLYHRFRIHEAGSVVEKQARDLQIGDKLCEWELPRGVCVNGEACLRIVVDDCYVVGVEDAGVCDKVYCAREPKRGTLMFNNVVTMNCGEQPLLPYEACNLGSINLSKFVAISGIDGKPYFDYPRLDVYVRLAVRFLDNVITASVYPLPEITKTVKRNRKIGLGVMGWADTLFQLGIPYNSDEAVNMAEIVMARIQEYAYRMSEWLAEQRGAFPAFDKSRAGANGEKPLRNATLTTIAPTGTLSIIGECSSGIEPLFALSFTRNVMDGAKLVETNVHFEDALREAGVYSEELMAKVAAQGSVQDMEEIPEHIRKVFVTAADISPEYHLKMQAAFQQYTDNAVSKTVNLPNNATINDVHDIYMMAYETGCKGVTVYRDGCKSSQVLTTGKNAASPAPTAPAAVRVKKRPDVLPGKTFKVRTGLGVLYLTVNEIDGQPFEVFATIGKSGNSVTAKAEAIGRLVSLALRSGVPVEAVVAQIKGIGGEHPIFQQEGLLLSIPDAVATVLESEYMQDKAKSGVAPLLVESSCPECGAALVFQEGCPRCAACGFSKCG